MANDYYLILGIGDDASQDEIKSAYRREAKRLHPDCSDEGCEPFLDLHEAYEVLGDPEQRRGLTPRPEGCRRYNVLLRYYTRKGPANFRLHHSRIQSTGGDLPG